MSESKKAELQKLRDILLAAIDYNIIITRKRLTAKGAETLKDFNEHLKERVMEHYKKGRHASLQRSLNEMAEMIRMIGDEGFNLYTNKITGYEVDFFREDLDPGGTMIPPKNHKPKPSIQSDLNRQEHDQRLRLEISDVTITQSGSSEKHQVVISTIFINKIFEDWSPDKKYRLTIYESEEGTAKPTTFIQVSYKQEQCTVYSASASNLRITAAWNGNKKIVITNRKEPESATKASTVTRSKDVIRIEYNEC